MAKYDKLYFMLVTKTFDLQSKHYEYFNSVKPFIDYLYDNDYKVFDRFQKYFSKNIKGHTVVDKSNLELFLERISIRTRKCVNNSFTAVSKRLSSIFDLYDFDLFYIYNFYKRTGIDLLEIYFKIISLNNFEFVYLNKASEIFNFISVNKFLNYYSHNKKGYKTNLNKCNILFDLFKQFYIDYKVCPHIYNNLLIQIAKDDLERHSIREITKKIKLFLSYECSFDALTDKKKIYDEFKNFYKRTYDEYDSNISHLTGRNIRY